MLGIFCTKNLTSQPLISPKFNEINKYSKKSFITNAVERTGPSVVTIETQRFVKKRKFPKDSQIFLDPYFERFFGLDFPNEKRPTIEQSQGSGFIFDDGLVITNAHVVNGSEKLIVGLSNGAMHQLIRKRYPNEKFTVHGFRTTFRIWAAEVRDYDQNLAEIALAHSQDKKVEGAYMRSKLIDKRRAMMEDYANFATSAMHQQCMIAH